MFLSEHQLNCINFPKNLAAKIVQALIYIHILL